MAQFSGLKTLITLFNVDFTKTTDALRRNFEDQFKALKSSAVRNTAANGFLQMEEVV